MSQSDNHTRSQTGGQGRGSKLQNRWIKWIFLTGNRFVIAGGILAGIFVLATVAQLGRLTTGQQIRSLFYLFSALIGGNLTLITVVVSINQLVLSRELGAPGQIREQMRNMGNYREDVQEATGRAVLPIMPPDFLQLLLQTTRSQAQALDEMVAESTDQQVQVDVNNLVTALTEHVDHVDQLLESSEARPFKALSTTLQANYAERIHEASRIQATHGTALSDDAHTALETIIDRLQDIDVAREYFKTLFMQEELSYLSRVLLYVGIPAEASAMMLLITFATPVGTTLPSQIPLLIPVAVTIGFAPLAVLFAFVLRIATVTEHTAPIIPFTMPEQEP